MTKPGKGGRPKKPTAKRKREGGTARAGAVSHRPQPSTELVVVAGRDVPISPPEDLPAAARDVWEEIVRALAESGVLDKIDLPMLRAFCLTYARAQQAHTAIDEPIDDDEEAALDKRIEETSILLRALRGDVANALRARAEGVHVEVPPAKVNAVANLETTLANLEHFRSLRRRVGRLVALGSTGQIVESPLVSTERQAIHLLLRLAGRFGLTPADRAALAEAGLDLFAKRRGIENELDAEIGRSARGA